MIGKTLGPYQVVAKLGEGGMGQVFRATDTKLKRQVAIKILPPSLAADHERLARFQREAELLASLNHPHIAGIYGLEESDGLSALVMELVDGEDLSQRIARGAIPIDEALPIARQIAEALEAAHEQGIIHRDLKPANVKVRADGTVKVLDFGLAKAMDPTVLSSSDAMDSPTITSPAMTLRGVILGTAAYMAPEQAKGKSVDKRADIWAFGVVLYEMLTGRRLFDAEDTTETLAAVLTRDVTMTTLPVAIPARLRSLLRDCLIRDPKQRLRDIGDARIALDRIIAGAPDNAIAPAAAAATPVVPAWRRVLPWALAILTTIALAVVLFTWAPWRVAPAPAPRKLLALIGADASLPMDLGASATLSPDGTTLAFAAQQAGQTRLFVRKLDQLQAAALAGTEGAAGPFYSPDGKWIAFFAGGKLKKISETGGASIELCDAPNNRGGTWADDDTIIFTPVNGTNVKLMRVSASGGTPSVFGTLNEGAVTQRWPQALRGGKGVLYSEHSAINEWDSANLVIAPLSGGTPKIVVRGGHYGRYVPSSPGSSKQGKGGHLIYMQQGTLFAVPFDLDRLETVGQAVPAIEGVSANGAISGGAQLAVSSDGALVYVPAAVTSTVNPLDWMTRDGKTSVLRATRADWANPRFSPDGQKLALQISDGRQSDIWVYEWARDALTQLTFDPSEDQAPVWTPDGRFIVFSSDRAKSGIPNLYSVNAEGSGDVARLTDINEPHLFPAWHPSGKYLAFTAVRPATTNDLMILPIERDAARGLTPGKTTVLLSTPAAESHPMFSPDGRWIAYQSTEAGGSDDVYVRPFPGPGGKWRISTQGGTGPRWSAATHALMFLNLQGKVMIASYTIVGDSFRADQPQMWSPTSIRAPRNADSPYDLHPDGKRLATIAAADQGNYAQDKVVFVFNFAEYLRRIAP
jgi:Tol biopolymer transport system component